MLKDYGVVGDGQTDDTKALQRAIDEGNGVLDLEKGTYRITAPLVLDTTKLGYVGIRGPAGTARIIMAGPGPAIRIVGDHQGTGNPVTVKDHTWEKERFPNVTGFEIVGAHEEADGIELFRTMQTVIRHVIIRRCRYGIHLIQRNRNVIIAECHIYWGLDSGIFMDHVNLHQINIIGNHISYCARAGIRQLNGDVHNVQITGNDIEYNAGFGIDPADAEGGAEPATPTAELLLEVPDEGVVSEYTICSNTIQALATDTGANIFVRGRLEPRGAVVGCFSIAGNVIGSRTETVVFEHAHGAVSITGNTIYSGIDANVRLDHCRNTIVANNNIRSTSVQSVKECERGGVILNDCSDCSITGNIINDQGPHADEGGTVELKKSRRVTVANCQITGSRACGIWVEDSTDCAITGNSVLKRPEGPAMAAAIAVIGESARNLVQANMVNAGTHGNVVCTESEGILVNNTILPG